IAAIVVGNHDRRTTVGRQDHRGIVEAGEKAAVRARAAGLFEREMQIAPVDTERHENAVEIFFSSGRAHPCPAPVALGQGIAGPIYFRRCFHACLLSLEGETNSYSPR